MFSNTDGRYLLREETWQVILFVGLIRFMMYLALCWFKRFRRGPRSAVGPSADPRIRAWHHDPADDPQERACLSVHPSSIRPRLPRVRSITHLHNTAAIVRRYGRRSPPPDRGLVNCFLDHRFYRVFYSCRPSEGKWESRRTEKRVRQGDLGDCRAFNDVPDVVM